MPNCQTAKVEIIVAQFRRHLHRKFRFILCKMNAVILPGGCEQGNAESGDLTVGCTREDGGAIIFPERTRACPENAVSGGFWSPMLGA